MNYIENWIPLRPGIERALAEEKLCSCAEEKRNGCQKFRMDIAVCGLKIFSNILFLHFMFHRYTRLSQSFPELLTAHAMRLEKQ